MKEENNSSIYYAGDTFSENNFWKEAYRHIENARNAINKRNQLSDAEKERILKERALVLAKLPPAETDRKETIKVMEFILASERYGVEPVFIREVYPLKGLTNIPCTPEYVCGVINLRGQLISVIDIKKFFGMADKSLTDMNKVIVLHSENMELGVLADEIVCVRDVLLENVQSSLPTLTDIREDYLKGVTNERMVILDGKKLLNDENIIVNEEL